MLKDIELLRLIGNRSGIDEYVNNPNYSKSSKIYSNVDNEWEKIPGRFELAKSEIFLKRNECVIDNLII